MEYLQYELQDTLNGLQITINTLPFHHSIGNVQIPKALVWS